MQNCELKCCWCNVYNAVNIMRYMDFTKYHVLLYFSVGFFLPHHQIKDKGVIYCSDIYRQFQRKTILNSPKLKYSHSPNKEALCFPDG